MSVTWLLAFCFLPPIARYIPQHSTVVQPTLPHSVALLIPSELLVYLLSPFLSYIDWACIAEFHDPSLCLFLSAPQSSNALKCFIPNPFLLLNYFSLWKTFLQTKATSRNPSSPHLIPDQLLWSLEHSTVSLNLNDVFTRFFSRLYFSVYRIPWPLPSILQFPAVSESQWTLSTSYQMNVYAMT